MDKFSPDKRSEIMRHIHGKDTGPEKKIRSTIHRMGFRYRMYVPNLPGKPDLVFPGKKRVIFVHGCFWHHHKNCKRGNFPKSRKDYWIPKLLRNQARDVKNAAKLRRLGWKVMVIWQCEISDMGKLSRRIARFLG